MAPQAVTAASAAPQSRANSTPPKELYPMVNWKYDLFLWIMGVLVDLFFREVHPRGSWKVPRSGPILFVAAPHANQVCVSLCAGTDVTMSDLELTPSLSI
jgi:glycerol-3-phosphate O-acyltransferase / dihydroxyacetone phosphate acyltransferase